GRFMTKGDVDCYVFSAKKGLFYDIDVQTFELSSPTEVYLTLKDTKGNQLGATNPQEPAHLLHQAAADGDYFLSVEHLFNWSGPSETYHLTITPHLPGFELAAGIERFDVHPGTATAIPLWVTRKGHNVYKGPIEV